MGQKISNHEYIRKIIWDIFKNNKISKLESQKLEQVMLNFDQQDWKNFKITAKEAVNELFDQKIEESKIPEQWKIQIKELSRVFVNFLTALFNDELLTEAT